MTHTDPMVKKIIIFVDVQNIYYTTRQAYGRQFNYRKLWQRISAEGEIIAATAYATHRNDDKQIKFPHTLNGSGVALARLISTILENYQNIDRTITIIL